MRISITAFSAFFFLTSHGYTQETGPAERVDSVTSLASEALANGRPWKASQILAKLSPEQLNQPEVALLAARAAVGWGGWNTIIRLLGSKPWLDRLNHGEGFAILGLAYLERGDLVAAVTHTRKAAERASRATLGERLVLHARALDQAGEADSAARVYRRAAGTFPQIKDWLLLRAAATTNDSGARYGLYQQLESPVARARIGSVEARTRERLKDWEGAAREYDAIGARVSALRIRLASADAAERKQLRSKLLATIAKVGPSDAALAIELFDREFPKQTASEQLAIARRAADIRMPERAVKGFKAAGKALTDKDRFEYATVLARIGQGEKAVAQLRLVKTRSLLGKAAYLRARQLLRLGKMKPAVAALRKIPVRFPKDSESAAGALFLIAGIHVDQGHDDSARKVFTRIATRYSKTAFGQRAAFQAAIIAFLKQNFVTARKEFEQIANDSTSKEAMGAVYWAGRAAFATGDTTAAREKWESLVETDSYYGWLASKRLGRPFKDFGPPTSATATESLPPALSRATLLTRLNLGAESSLEIDAFVREANDSVVGMAAARALCECQWHARAVRLAIRALPSNPRLDRSVAEVLYPLPFAEVLNDEAVAMGVDPMLAAGVIRQESLFDPRARSVAEARGLMQLLPSVGAKLARKAGLEDWETAMLYQPEFNLVFGISHLATALLKTGTPERALAAYNAGLDRVARWQSIRGISDVEIFVERIPFVETRDYVRKVRRNQAIYTALYGRRS